MISIKASFREIQKKNPELADYVCFIRAVRGRKFSRRAIRESFLICVDFGDYDRVNLGDLINQLHIASNTVVDDHFVSKIALFDVESLREVSMAQI